MRKLSLSLGLVLFALAGSARAQDETPAPAPAAEPGATAAEPAAPEAAAAPEKRIQVGVAFLPMFLGKAGIGDSGNTEWSGWDAAYGVNLTIGYNVIAGLSLGIAPQIIFHLNTKNPNATLKSEDEFDLMARVAYAYNVIPKLAVYAEFLPGYSIVTYNNTINTKKPDRPKGLVLGFGGGAMYDITDMVFVNLGVGYQFGFQGMAKPEENNKDYEVHTRFLRIALGGGMKF